MKKNVFIILLVLAYNTLTSQISYETYIDNISGSLLNDASLYNAAVASDNNGNIALLIPYNNTANSDSLYFVVYDNNKDILVDTNIYFQVAGFPQQPPEITKFQFSPASNTYFAIINTVSNGFGYTSNYYFIEINTSGTVVNYHLLKNDYLVGDYSVLLSDFELFSDGSVICSGYVEDNILFSIPTRSVLLKFSPSGNIIWQKIYESPSLKPYFYGIEAYANDKFVVASGLSPVSNNPDSIYLSINAFDTSGTLLWNRNIDLDTIPGIGPSEPTGMQISFINNNFIVGVNANDANFTSMSILFSLDTNGNVLNAKQIIEGTGIEVNNFFERGNDVIVLGTLSYNKRFLFKLNNNLDTSMLSMLQAPFNAITNAAFHPSGGIVGVGDYYPSPQFIFKTDDSLLVRCQDSTFTFFEQPFTQVDDNINFLSLYMGTFIKDTFPTLGYSAPISSFTRSNGCGCNQTISGVGRYMSTPSDSIELYLYKAVNIGDPYILTDSTVTDASGNYIFSYVQTANYIVKAEPVAPKYPDAVRTYFSSSPQWPYWDSADVVTTSCLIQPTNIDIDLIQNVAASHTGGPGILSGYVFEAAGYNNQRLYAPGDPIPGIDITVSVPPPSPPSVVGTTTTDGNGYYQFTNMNLNDTFIVSVDYPGMPNDSVYSVELTITNITEDSLNFYIDSSIVYIPNSGTVTGENTEVDIIDGVSVYPVPANDYLNVHFSSSVSYIQITDITGKVVYKQSTEGFNNVAINVSDFSSGIYFMTIRKKEGIFIKKIQFR